MTPVEKFHAYRVTPTRCPRCRAVAGSEAWSASIWLMELTIDDGVRSVHALLCRRPSCGFAEIRSVVDGSVPTTRTAYRHRLRAAAMRHPFTFAAAGLVYGVVLGLVLVLA